MLLRPIFYVVGMLITLLSLFMLIPATVEFLLQAQDWRVFVGASAVSGFIGIGFTLSASGGVPNLTVRQTFLLTSISWLTLVNIGALPFFFSIQNISWVDALFESTSGLSTAGSTVLQDLNHMLPGLLLWRALLNWVGGIGIIMIALVVLPYLRIGGMQIFRTESSDQSNRPAIRAHNFIVSIILFYVSITVISAILFQLSGMCWFDAVCHAMATVSTGGFSTRDESLGAFPNPSTWWVATLSIIAGSIPITFWIRLFQRGWRVKLDSQILVYLFLLAVCSIVMTFCALRATSLSFWIAFSHAAVNVTSIVSNCGLVSTDYSRWGNFAAACFFFFCFVGGCTGSTTGSIKIYRWQILYLALRNQFLLMVQPHRTIVTIYGSKQVSGNVMPSVISFFAAYVLCFALCSVVLSAFDLDFITSTSAAASSLAGAGPGLGQLIGPGHNYALLPDGAKLVLCLAMLLGRLEIFTLLVILMPTFWRD